MRRPRGPGGRFLTAEEIAAQRLAAGDDPGPSPVLDNDHDHDDDMHDEDVVVDPEVPQLIDQSVPTIRPRDAFVHTHNPTPLGIIDLTPQSNPPISHAALHPTTPDTLSSPPIQPPHAYPLVHELPPNGPPNVSLRVPYHTTPMHHVPHSHIHDRHHHSELDFVEGLYAGDPSVINSPHVEMHRRTGEIMQFHAQGSSVHPRA